MVFEFTAVSQRQYIVNHGLNLGILQQMEGWHGCPRDPLLDRPNQILADRFVAVTGGRELEDPFAIITRTGIQKGRLRSRTITRCAVTLNATAGVNLLAKFEASLGLGVGDPFDVIARVGWRPAMFQQVFANPILNFGRKRFHLRIVNERSDFGCFVAAHHKNQSQQWDQRADRRWHELPRRWKQKSPAVARNATWGFRSS